MQGKDYGSYKDQRRRDHRKMAGSMKDGAQEDMFFGASPKERKALRKTKDKRAIDVDKLDLDALDRDKFGAGEKVGQSLKLIDMAMGNEPTPPQGVQQQQRAPSNKPPSRLAAISGFFRKATRKKKPKPRKPVPERDDFKPAPAAENEGVVVAKPRGRLLERAAAALAVVCALLAGYAWQGSVPAIAERAAAQREAHGEAGALVSELAGLAWTREGLLGLAIAFAWTAVGVRVRRQARGGLVAESLRALCLAGLPALVGGLAAWWATLTGPHGAPGQLSAPLLEALGPTAESTGAAPWLLLAAPFGLACLLVAAAVRWRAPRV